MAVTENTYTGNGSTVLYSFTFPYLATTDIKVSINGTLTTAYTLANATTVQFNTAPANGAAIRIYRQTDDASTKATFFPGSAIRSQDLNDNFLQVLYKSQETETFAANTDASAIQATANAALANSNTAISTANAATATANAADATANGIAATANTALSNSTAAVSTANTASTTATSALTTANSASTTASSALTTASSALTTANAALPLAGGTLTGNLNIPSLNGGQLAGSRNRIINGDLRVDQRNVGILVNAQGYAVDRFFTDSSGLVGLTVTRSTVAPAGFKNSLSITIGTADSSLSSTDFAAVGQRIEGNNILDLGWGASGASSVTLSFWVRSSVTGTFAGGLSNASGIRSYVFTYTISSANVWEYKTITIPGVTHGIWETGTNTGIVVQWDLGSGSNYQQSPGSWNLTSFGACSTNTSVKLSATLNATFYITGVQLEAGTVATPFERRSYGQELALCQRYFYMHCKGNAQSIGVGTAYNASLMSIYISMPVTMRINPSAYYSSGTNFYISYINGSSDTFNSPGNLVAGSPSNVTFDATDGVSVSAGSAGRVATNSSDAYIGLSAEL
jgi:hypothetical protein